MNDEKDKVNASPRPPEAIDELALQNVLRKRHCKDWPNVILQLTKRVQAVNQTWAQVVVKLMSVNGLRISWYQQDEKLIVEVRYISGVKANEVDVEEVELHEITAAELQEASQYIEVLLMDKLDHSELIARVIADLGNEPKA